MKIIVLGARGDVGSRVVAEAVSRGHEVSAVVRDPAHLPSLPPSVRGIVADASDADQLARIMAGYDLAVSALRPPEGREDELVPLTHSVLAGAARAGIRVLVVGGAASLKLPEMNGTTVLTAPGFLPASVVPIARASQAQFELCQTETGADWSYLSPPANLLPGKRTGRYRRGSDTLLLDAEGDSRISMEDLAVAMIDEAEKPGDARTRFTVAY